MINKDELVDILNKARAAEEQAIPIYAKHMGSAVFWAGLTEKDAAKVRSLLTDLAEESDIHKRILDGLIAKIKERPENAF